MPKKLVKALLRTLRQMNLLGNGDRPIAKLGETLTGVSINKPLIRKKEPEQSSSGSTGGEYQWHTHICMHAEFSTEGLGPTGGFTNGTGSPTHSRLTLAERVPLFDCAVNPRHPPFHSSLPPSAALAFSTFSPLTSLSAQCSECSAVHRDSAMIDCGGGPSLPR